MKRYTLPIANIHTEGIKIKYTNRINKAIIPICLTPSLNLDFLRLLSDFLHAGVHDLPKPRTGLGPLAEVRQASGEAIMIKTMTSGLSIAVVHAIG